MNKINYFDTPNQRRQNIVRYFSRWENGEQVDDFSRPIINPCPEGDAHKRLSAELYQNLKARKKNK